MPRPDLRRALDAFTDAELDTLSIVTPGEIADAKRTWRADAPVSAKGWLDATVPTPTEDVRAADVAKRDTTT